MVAWRGRGWLFGGRTQHQACSNQLYMFDPNYRSIGSAPEGSGKPTPEFQSLGRPPVLTRSAKSSQPCWAEVIGITGSAPSPRDGHASAVLEDAMFVFGGFEDEFSHYDNQIHRLDFHTWSWTLIQIHPLSACAKLPRHYQPVPPSSQSAPLYDQMPQSPTTNSPLPRDFASLLPHQGRLFVFGGRSECPTQRGNDVYDSALWELVPLQVQTASTMVNGDDQITGSTSSYTVAEATLSNYSHLGGEDQTTHACGDPLCSVASSGEVQRMLWEEETGNWASNEYWATAPTRPCCLWRYVQSHNNSIRTTDDPFTSDWSAANLVLQTSTKSRWTSGSAVWYRLHQGHGLQSPDELLPRLITEASTRGHSRVASLESNAPFGRRSLSNWSYKNNLYIGFGTVHAVGVPDWLQLHFDDVWRFNLTSLDWTHLRGSTTETNNTEVIAGRNRTYPSCRRRAIACLYQPRPPLYGSGSSRVHPPHRPRVYVFGGTQPSVLQTKSSPTVNPERRRSRTGLANVTRPYALLASMISLLPNMNQPVSQNQLLGFPDNESPSQSDPFDPTPSTLLCSSIRSPIAVLLLQPHQTSSPLPQFQLFLVCPSNAYPLSNAFTSHLATGTHARSRPDLAGLCVMRWTDLVHLFAHHPNAAQWPSSSGHPFPRKSSVSPVSSVTDWLHHSVFGMDLTNELDRLQWYQALRLAWLAGRRVRANESEATEGGGVVRMRTTLVQQSYCCSARQNSGDSLASDPSVLESFANGDGPCLLDTRLLSRNRSGQIHLDPPGPVQSKLTLNPPLLSSVIQPALRRTASLLITSTQWLLGRDGLSHLSDPLVFRTPGEQGSHVWIDSEHLLQPLSIPIEASTPTREEGDAIGAWSSDQTLTGLLHQFARHLDGLFDREAEQHLVVRVDPSNEPNIGSNDDLTSEIRRLSPVPIASTSRLVTRPTIAPREGDDSCAHSKEFTSPSYLNNQSESPSLHSAFRFDALPPLAAMEPDDLRTIRGDDDRSTSEDDENIEDDQVPPGLERPETVVFEGIGSLVLGREKLIELADCYMMHLDTSLYDICLRRLRSLNPDTEFLVSNVPRTILHQLKAIYHNSSSHTRQSSFG